MRLTAEQLNRATLARQLLLERHELDVVDGVRRVLALQAQEPAAPYVAMWNRLHGFDPAALDDALSSSRLVKATLMRVTLHMVGRDDHGWLRAAMLPRIRAARVNDRRFRDEGLAPSDADGLVEDLLAVTATPGTGTEVVRRLTERRGVESLPERLWWALRTYGPLVRAPTGGPWSFRGTSSFVAAPDAHGPQPSWDEAVAMLVRRYLEGFGPASIADVAQYSLLTRRTVRAAVSSLEDRLVEVEGPGGEPLLDVRDGVVPPVGTPAPPRLLGMWDSVLLAHADRTRIIDDDVRARTIRRNGDTLPAVLVDGRVRGVWRLVDGEVEVTPFGPLSDDAWAGLSAEAAALRVLIERDGSLFGRYDRWWQRLPDGDRRVLLA